ncbi:RRQRL motif-containing zinc-binding protein [Halostreptopolyspora alba]|uniref:RRQRL motif-containing zinc-binding protein n=1 Tax=Halostreptopolyspora alba TaxID=2487137 RepID=UPI0026AF0B50
MSPARFLDPEGARYGLPTYPWGWARVYDPDLATRDQLAEKGLRPGGQDPVAQLMWRSRRTGARGGGVRTAWLYRISLAAPKRTMTPARRRSIAAALRARRRCATCERVYRYCIPTSLGECPNCFYDTEPEQWELDDDIDLEMRHEVEALEEEGGAPGRAGDACRRGGHLAG